MLPVQRKCKEKRSIDITRVSYSRKCITNPIILYYFSKESIVFTSYINFRLIDLSTTMSNVNISIEYFNLSKKKRLNQTTIHFIKTYSKLDYLER